MSVFTSTSDAIRNWIILSKGVINIFNLPTQIKKLTVLKSPHGHKKSREQFQFKKHNKLITLNFVSKTEFLKLRYTLLNIIPASITLKILFKKINS